ncbi:hypothetical protein H5410_048666 [Solanum commersonii]|uniref:Amine oxidase domain-containing protein n=1 Tax=Solanum commersonii TaxID=4109 RepID=A0A9J5XMF2_SOLCO|nr:hypothetical protein H5410_048666 [Solanum commersonii]
MKVAVVGAGISGLVSAYELAKSVRPGVIILVHIDVSKKVSKVTYPNMMEFFESLGVDMEITDISFSVSLDQGLGCEWSTHNGFSSLFAQKKNLLNPYFWQMIREISRFKQDVISYLEALDNNPDMDHNETLGQLIESHGYSELFQKAYLIPICASIWSCPIARVLGFSAYYILSFFHDHHLLQVKEEVEKRGCQIRTGCEIELIWCLSKEKALISCTVLPSFSYKLLVILNVKERAIAGCTITFSNGANEIFDGCIMATHAPDTLDMLGKEATFDETRILSAFQYVHSDTFLHRDKTFLPRDPTAWSACNFLGTINNRGCATYWLNIIQNLGDSKLSYLVTLDPPHTPEHTLLKWRTSHPVPSVTASKASRELHQIQGKRGIWFCGVYQVNKFEFAPLTAFYSSLRSLNNKDFAPLSYGFHANGLKAGMVIADGMLRRSCSIRDNPKHMVPTWPETGARLIVTRFFKSFIQTGCIILLEEGGTIFTFQGTDKKCSLKVSLRVHSTQFYWKVATEADIGLSDAFIHGDFSFVDKHEGLLNFFMIYVANRDLKASVKTFSKKSSRGWWTPLLFTAGLSSAKYFIRHVSNRNTLTQARRNISHHYDLSNEHFSLFLDETMTYSCAIFKSEDEDLKDAQLRKISLLIRKAKISKEHHILEIGFGWGSLAVEVVKQTGCKYTGITLSEQQLEYAQLKVEQAGLQDQITFILCDYRQIPNEDKYDRIISVEMLEHVGHDFIGEFFSCCETALAEDGLLVLQFISIPDQRYDDHRHSTDFLREYIFPGGSFHALSQVTSAMTAASRLCQIRALGFDDKFIRTWEYYFDYCAAGFKTCTIGDYQIVFSRPGNVATFGDPYNVTMPSAC